MSNEGIELKVYDYKNPNRYIDTLHYATEQSYLEQLGDVGSGSFQVQRDDPQILDDPSLLYYRSVVKYCIDGNVVGAFLIENRKKVYIKDERTAEVKQVTGQGLLTWLADAVVGPGIRRTRYGTDKRYFTFASERGDWYNDSLWKAAEVVGSWGDAPWKKRPAKWPGDHRAKWIKASRTADEAQSIFRFEFTIDSDNDGDDWVIYAAADDYLEMWLDGEKIADSDFEKSSLDQATRIEISQLNSGAHVMAARVTNRTGRSALMFAMYHINKTNGNHPLQYYSGQAGTSWRALYLGDGQRDVPVWSPGEIILKLIQEAKNRNVWSMSWIKPTFTSTRDSDGVAWIKTDEDWEFNVGQDTVYVAIQKIAEKLGYYFWIDPDTYELNISQSRGTRHDTEPNAIVFELGKNLLDSEIEGVGNKRKNYMWAKASTGWVVGYDQIKDAASIAKYGTLEGYYSADITGQSMLRVLPRVLKQTADAEEGATYDILTNEYVPWRSFDIGDYVKAPDYQGLDSQRRVVSISVKENSETGEPEYTLEFDVSFQSTDRKLASAINKLTGGSAGSGLASSGGLGSSSIRPVLPPSTEPPANQPMVPLDLAANSVGTWTPDGITPVSTITLTWTGVVLDSDGNEIVPDYYEIWGTKSSTPLGMAQLMTVTGTTAIITPVTPGQEWQFKVRAVAGGSAGDFSAIIKHTGLAPNSPLPAPTAPSLSSSMGLLKVHWDGLTIEGEPAPQFRYVYAQIAQAETGPWSIAGAAIQRGGGDTTIPGLTIDSTYWVRLRAVDGVAIPSAASATANIKITGVDLGPLKQDLENAIAAVAKATADVRLNVNMLKEPSFEETPLTAWELGAGAAQAATSPRTGVNHIRVTSNGTAHDVLKYIEPIPVDPGISFYWKVYIKRATGTALAGEFQMGAYTKALPADPWTNYVKMADSLAFDATGYQIFQGYLTVPENHRWIQPVIRVMDTVTGHVTFIDDARMFVMTDDTTVVPGSINADALAAGSVIAGKLAAGSVDTQALQAESIIGVHIGAQEITGDKMAFNTLTGNHMQVGSIGVEQLSPSIGNELDISANGAVNIIVGRIQDIEDSDFAQNDDLEQMQTYYAFTDEGAIISTPGSPFAVAVRNDRIEMLENGTPVSYWNSGTLYVDQMVGTTVVLGNHQLEQYGTGTVVRAIS